MCIRDRNKPFGFDASGSHTEAQAKAKRAGEPVVDDVESELSLIHI